MTTLDRVCGVLDQHSIRYALIGAAALAAYGVARSTFDIDLLTTDRRVLETGLWTLIPEPVDIRRGDVDDPLAGVIRIAAGTERPIDIVVGKHPWQTRAVERAKQLGGTPVVEPGDLILLKLYAGGAQDLWDIRELLKHTDPSVVAQVTSDLAQLPASLGELWKRTREPYNPVP